MKSTFSVWMYSMEMLFFKFFWNLAWISLLSTCSCIVLKLSSNYFRYVCIHDPLPYLTRFTSAKTVLLPYLYPPVLIFPNWLDFITVLKNTIRIMRVTQHTKCHGNYREAKLTAPNPKYVLTVHLAK